MPVITCPKCRSKYDPGVDDELEDIDPEITSLKVVCPECGQWLRLPEMEAIPVPKLPKDVMEALRKQSKLIKKGSSKASDDDDAFDDRPSNSKGKGQRDDDSDDDFDLKPAKSKAKSRSNDDDDDDFDAEDSKPAKGKKKLAIDPDVPVPNADNDAYEMRCKECKTQYTVDYFYAGKTIACKNCGAPMRVPMVGGDKYKGPRQTIHAQFTILIFGMAMLALMVIAVTIYGIAGFQGFSNLADNGLDGVGLKKEAEKKNTGLTPPPSIPAFGSQPPVSDSKSTLPPKQLTKEDEQLLGTVILICGLSLAFSVPMASLLFIIWFWRAWAAVPEKYGGIPPIKAIGLMMVPFFNIYWMFKVVPGLSQGLADTYNARLPKKPLKGGRIAGFVTCITYFVPCLWFITAFAFIIWFSGADACLARILYYKKQERQLA